MERGHSHPLSWARWARRWEWSGTVADIASLHGKTGRISGRGESLPRGKRRAEEEGRKTFIQI